MAEQPKRLQLSRKKGFDLQARSLAANGLPAVNVARPGKWGNRFVVGLKKKFGRATALGYVNVESPAQAVASFRDEAECWHRDFTELRGKNLACWCKPGAPCHADVLLELANRPICEAIERAAGVSA